MTGPEAVRPGGSIPARAGEPTEIADTASNAGVYPRACGGTPGEVVFLVNRKGLSPRVRGNHVGVDRHVQQFRSIPARAGEPRGRHHRPRPRLVYPRACGGTYAGVTPHSFGTGLSPRVRGNPYAEGLQRGNLASIPARAGEPEELRTPTVVSKVYPRACGGTRNSTHSGPLDCGLSPRVRGNLQVAHVGLLVRRSIPARAGEPSTTRPPPMANLVYPRACGGTGIGAQWAVPVLGLSPRVRGNPGRPGTARYGIRSIPARAGEPHPPTGVDRRSWVYPRACGGTPNIR